MYKNCYAVIEDFEDLEDALKNYGEYADYCERLKKLASKELVEKFEKESILFKLLPRRIYNPCEIDKARSVTGCSSWNCPYEQTGDKKRDTLLYDFRNKKWYNNSEKNYNVLKLMVLVRRKQLILSPEQCKFINEYKNYTRKEYEINE